MNNNNFGSILLGAAIGAGIGYLVADWYIETYIPEEGFELEPTDQITKFEKRLTKVRVAKPKEVETRNYSEFFKKKQGLSELVRTYGGESKEDTVVTDTLNFEDALLEENGLSDLNEDEETEEMLDDGNDPGIISVDVYASDEEFIHTTLRYYTDDVLTDEAGVPINRPEAFLPENALVSFGEMSRDPDIVYVRNTQKKCMYEIVRMDTAYAGSDQRRVKRTKAVKEMGNVNGEDD